MPEEKEVVEPLPSLLADGIKREVLAVQDYARLSFESLSNRLHSSLLLE